MFCDSLRDNGLSVVGEPAAGEVTGDAYVVRLKRFGQPWVIRVSHDKPLGTEVDHWLLPGRDLLEAPWAVARLGRAIARGESLQLEPSPLPAAVPVVPQIRKTRSELVVGPGVSTVSIAGSLLGLASGFNLNMYYERPRWALGLGGYFVASYNIAMGGVFIGARHYLSAGRIAPLIGGGVLYSGAEAIDFERGDGAGAGASFYGDLGLVFFRLS